MKKRTFSLIATLCLAINLTACSDNGSTAETSEPQQNAEAQTIEAVVTAEAASASAEDDAQEYDLETLYQAILASQPEEKQSDIVMFPEGDPVLIEMMYEGLGDVAIEEQVFYVAPITGFACEVMLIKAADEASAQAAYDIFNARIQKGADDTFYPETAALWATNAQAQREGLYVCMVALPDGCTIPEDVFALI